MNAADKIPKPDPGEWNGTEYVFDYWTRIRNRKYKIPPAVHHPHGPADPHPYRPYDPVFWRWAKTLAGNKWTDYVLEKLDRWPTDLKTPILNLRHQPWFEPKEQRLSRIVVDIFRWNDERTEVARQAREDAVEKPTYPVTTDIGKLADAYRPMVEAAVKRILFKRDLYDVPDADTEQLSGDIILTFCRIAQAGKIRAEHGDKSYVTYLKSLAVQMTGKFATRTKLERRWRAEDPGIIFKADETEKSPGGEPGESDAPAWLETLYDFDWAGMRNRTGDRTSGVPDSHLLGRPIADEYEKEDRFEKAFGPMARKHVAWLFAWLNSRAAGDERAGEYDYDLLRRVFGITRNQIKKALQIAKGQLIKKEFIARIKACHYDRGELIPGDGGRPWTDPFEGGFRFVAGYQAKNTDAAPWRSVRLSEFHARLPQIPPTGLTPYQRSLYALHPNTPEGDRKRLWANYKQMYARRDSRSRQVISNFLSEVGSEV